MVINLKLVTKASQWDVTFLGATKRTKASNLSGKQIFSFWFGLMRWSIRDRYTVNSSILVASTSRKLSCLTKKQNNKPISLSQITGHCSGTMGYRLKGNRTREDLFIYYLFVLFNGVERRKFSSFGWFYDRSVLSSLFCKCRHKFALFDVVCVYFQSVTNFLMLEIQMTAFYCRPRM